MSACLKWLSNAVTDPYRTSCDASGKFDSNTAGDNLRLCWHTSGGALQGGWHVGSTAFLNGSWDFERLIFRSNGVPEPAAWALMIAGFGLVGAAQRRRREATIAA